MNRRLFLTVLAAGVAVAVLVPAPAHAGSAPKKEGAAEVTTLTFPTLTATIMRPTGRRGVLAVSVSVDVPDAALRTRVDQSRPFLRDAWNTVLNREGAAMSPGGAPDVERLSAALQKACDRVIGRPGARVLIGSVIVN